jgi:hypothetical protein
MIRIIKEGVGFSRGKEPLDEVKLFPSNFDAELPWFLSQSPESSPY